jgi:hypothetical protein
MTHPQTRTMVLVYKNLQNWVILFGQILVNIPAPWSIWDQFFKLEKLETENDRK